MLTEAELQNAYEAIEHHGYSGLVPLPPEWEVVKEHWENIKQGITTLDLDDYTPSPPMLLFAPKSHATVRPVYLLHPIDLIIYSALTLIIKDDIEAQRVPVGRKRVFSYRADQSAPNRFYATQPTFVDFREESRRKAARATTNIVAVADIADFFPRIYQHRLENVIEASAQTPRAREVARVLVRKFIANLLSKNSYGVPIGPFSSRVLAEAVLIDVDAALLSDGADFVRWVDDYNIFCRSETEAQRVLFRLAERLFNNHGLTLSAIKTKILPVDEFQDRMLRDHEAEVEDEFRALQEIAANYNPYTDEEIELNQEELEVLEHLNFRRLLGTALEDHALVDYERLQVVLRHPALLQRLSDEKRGDIADVLLANVEHLYPIAEFTSKFFQTFSTSSATLRRKIARALLNSIKSYRGRWPPEYHIVWVLSVFASSNAWGGGTNALNIFQMHPSDAVRRFAALSLHANGSRSDAVAIKNEYTQASPLTRLAILLVSRKMGNDERRHWRQTLQLSGILEKLV